MADDFIPEVWAKKAESEFEVAMPEYNLVNHDYEGEISQAGDTVHIFVPGDVTVKPYTRNQDMDAPEVPNDEKRTMTVNQEEYVHVYVDKVTKVQSNQERLTRYTRKGIKRLRQSAGNYILNQYPYVHVDNILTPTEVVDYTNIHKYFAEMSERLDFWEDHDEDERCVVVSPKMMTIFKLFFGGRQTDFGDKVAAGGFQGNFEGWKVFKSNRVPKVLEDIDGDTVDEEVHKILFGVPEGITFAWQINPDNVKKYEPERRSGEAVKILTVYDALMLAEGKRNGLLNAFFQ